MRFTALAVLALFGTLPANQTLLLSGTTLDYGEVPDSPSLSGLNQLTTECWMYPLPDTGASNGIEVTIAQYSSFLGDGPFAMAYYRGIQRMRPIVNWGFSGTAWFDGNTPVLPGEWTHVAMTHDGSMLRLYVNGVLDSQRTALGPIGESAIPIRIGAQAGSSTNHLTGLLDDVRMWNVARTGAEIASSMFGLAPGDDEGLVGHWEMEDAPAAGVVADSSSFGNDGTLHSMARVLSSDVDPASVRPKARLGYKRRPRGKGDPMVP